MISRFLFSAPVQERCAWKLAAYVSKLTDGLYLFGNAMHFLFPCDISHEIVNSLSGILKFDKYILIFLCKSRLTKCT